MALPDFTTQDPATYKANIDSTADDHETRIDANTLTLLDTPEELFAYTLTTSSSWVTFDMSGGGTAAAAAAAAGARIALLKITAYIATASTSAQVLIGASTHFAKSGSPAITTDNKYSDTLLTKPAGATANQSIHQTTSSFNLNLDVNSDFQYRVNITDSYVNLNSVSIKVQLLGYYS